MGRIAERLARTPSLAVAALFWASVAGAGQDWFPPRPVSVYAPNVTFKTGVLQTLNLVIRTSGNPANLRWTAIPSGVGYVPTPLQTTGTVSLGADQIATIPISFTIPNNVPDAAVGFITYRVTYEPGTTRAAPDLVTQVRPATVGRPEFVPVPYVKTTAAGAVASLVFELRASSGTTDQYSISVQRANPDSTNGANLFPYTRPTTPVTLPGNGTVQVSIPLFVPGNAFAGNANVFTLTASSVTDPEKVSDVRGFVVATSADPDSLPTSFYATGLVKQPLQNLVTGRDGPVPVPGRNLLLVAAGNYGVSVVRDSGMAQMGPVDGDGNGLDDRQVGLIRPPSNSASIAVVPGFVNSSLEVMDLGLLAAGRGGLQLIDLRDLVDFPGQPWQDWHDFDGDGIDDRILRRLPMAGFVTDAEWFMTPEGRVIALAAVADTGSIPTSVAYNPALTVPGTGAGVVAIDVLAALDSLPGVPFAAGAVSTPGTALDLELRGGPDPVLAVADGAGGVGFYALTAVGSPATVTFTPIGTVALDATWGTPYARDLAWIHDHGDSSYLAVATGAGGLQVIHVPPLSQPPFLALVQRTEAPAIGTATSPFGYVAVAMGASGANLLKMPSFSELGQIDALASTPYQAPVILDIGAPWTQGPLRKGLHGAISSSILSMRFRPFTGDAFAPDLMCADGARTLVLRTGTGGTLGVGGPGPGDLPSRLRLMVTPNPVRGTAEFRIQGDWATSGALAPFESVEFSVIDLQGRVLRRLLASPPGSRGSAPWSITWDGRDQGGRPAAPGRYFLRAVQPSGWSARGGFVLLR